MKWTVALFILSVLSHSQNDNSDSYSTWQILTLQTKMWRKITAARLASAKRLQHTQINRCFQFLVYMFLDTMYSEMYSYFNNSKYYIYCSTPHRYLYNHIAANTLGSNIIISSWHCRKKCDEILQLLDWLNRKGYSIQKSADVPNSWCT